MGRKSNRDQTGFTLIELLVATVVFSVLLLVMVTAFIRIGDLFYKGVSMSKTQEDARTIVQSISDDIQFTKRVPQSGAGVWCVGTHRYLYQLWYPVDNTTHFGIQRDNQGAGCPTSACGAGCTNMLDANMQVNYFNISCNSGLCDVRIHLVFYGGDPSHMFSGSTTPYYKASDAQCNGSLTDTNLCAAVDYDSTVMVNTL